jgi:hypothetical protein
VVTVQVASKLRKSHKFGSNVKKPPQAPTWFRAFEERNNSRLDKIENRLDKQDEFNKVVTDYMKSHP